jgi:hypothetical protein
MKRTTLVEYDDALPAVQAIYDEIMNTMGTALGSQFPRSPR